MTKRTECPDCHLEGKYKKNVGVYEDGKMWCFRCEKMINQESNDITSVPLLSGGKFSEITKKRLSFDSVSAFNVVINKDSNGTPVLVFPFTKNGKLVAQKLKTADKEYTWLNYDKKLDMFGSHLHDSSRKNIIITEGEEDAIAVYQALGHGGSRSLNHVTSLQGGANSAVEFISNNYEKLAQYETVTLCFDEDAAGHKARDKVIPLFTKNKLRIVKLSRKDACEMLINNQEEELKWSVLKAEAIVPKGIVRMSDLTDEFFDYEPPLGIALPFPMLNRSLNGLRRGELTMVAAGSGLGKSVFTSNIIYDMIVNKGLKVVDIKLEEDKKKTIFNYAGMYFDNREYANHPKNMSSKQRLEFRNKFENYITHDHFGSLDSKELLAVLEYYALSEKVDFIFLDHISIAISGTQSSKEGERKDIDILVTKIRELINTSNVGFVCVSHLTNPSNGGNQWEEGRKVNRSALRGSGALAQLSDNIIGIEGDLTQEETKLQRTIRLLKTRYGYEQEALCDTFTYDRDTGKIHVITEFPKVESAEIQQKEYF
ncbi:Archaeal primase DnaG/twinkle, TOPRIM domain [uncultured Caudovirales phage]|uniref:Archaeal primase DnaG/twinkle, TOPRIM domain n=1 Tax=uncultured Caudovirales phage TaxID=2100421 RepID=A0A6J7XB93_9CAUD|nr:Archaeal primase DnaG/twinkle, TOPRIM domain [uncultured Caudovirales phage]CAB5228133.1 Archaeal primase DnaG/twinkle, TOPRIM domain [uncultured Caudovirales phage]